MTLTNYINEVQKRTDLTADEATALIIAALSHKAYL